ncbi:hypothetical protein HanRHA438_Chr01g0027571 [Helianthus annuus]|nr:hypothetical protein HanRHA438_Chr01g0027571 [Helianthus annuus]
MIHMLTRKLFRLIINHKLILTNRTNNNRINLKQRRRDLHRRYSFNRGFRRRRVEARRGSHGGRTVNVIGVKKVVNYTVKVRIIERVGRCLRRRKLKRVRR